MRPASLVAWRWPSLKYAGTVTTALTTSSPRYSSEISFISCRMYALTSGTLNTWSRSMMRTSSCGPSTMRYGMISSELRTAAEPHLRPINRFAA